jgi:hypothetical protein
MRLETSKGHAAPTSGVRIPRPSGRGGGQSFTSGLVEDSQDLDVEDVGEFRDVEVPVGDDTSFAECSTGDERVAVWEWRASLGESVLEFGGCSNSCGVIAFGSSS